MSNNMIRLTTSYKDIFTTVYIIKTPKGNLLFDVASYDEDIDNAIIPFLQENGVTPQNLKYVFISHNHKDHSGGLKRFMECYPDTCIVARCSSLKERYAEYNFYAPKDGDVLLDVLQVVSIPGHTRDSAALFDIRTKTLVTGDCLQLYGIIGSDDWASNITLTKEHFEALDKVRSMDIEEIFTAHDYYPYGYKACGKEEVARTLDACYAPLQRIRQLILENPEISDLDIREIYNSEEGIPTVREAVVTSMRKYINDED